MKEIYFDYASTTPSRKEVIKEITPFLTKKFGNPSSFHSKGLEAKKAIDESRKRIAQVLNCSPDEIIFTGSGTESINLAIKGVALKKFFEEKKGVILTQKTEHPAVIETINWLKKLGFEVITLSVNEEGVINLSELKKVIKECKEKNKEINLVTIMYANNEVGTIQPIQKIARICSKEKILFHTDACQATEYLDINTKTLGVDLMTLNGSKTHALKGTGLLFKKKGVQIEPLIHGGGQEFGLRGGTENIVGIVALAKAIELANKEKNKEVKRIIKLRNYFVKKVLKEIPKSHLNGSKNGLPNNANFSFEGVEGESVLLRLNEKKILASTGSACASSSLDASHVLLAMNKPHELAHSSIRFTLGKNSTKKQVNYTINHLKQVISFLRQLSPIWEEKEKGEKK